MHSFLIPSVLLPVLAHATPLTLRSGNVNPVYTSSFTWNDNCGPTVACGPSMAGIQGQGTTAANNVTYAAGQPIVSGKGAGCGQCWHLQATTLVYPANGKTWGTPVVAKINDQCTDGGYCDQTETRKLNTGFGKEVHFDLCGETGTAQQFFGALGMTVLEGYAQQVDCSMLSDGTQGSGAGNVVDGSAAGTGGGSAAATMKHQQPGGSSPTTSAPTNNPSLSPWANSTTQSLSVNSGNGGPGSNGQGSGNQGSGSQGSGSQGSGSQGSGGSSGSGGNGAQLQQGGSAQSGPQGSSQGTPKAPTVQGPSNGGTKQNSPPEKAYQPQVQQQHSSATQPSSSESTGNGHSHGSIQGLEQAAFKGASGGMQGMMKAMETYMEEAVNGDAPDDEDDECDEL